MRILKIVFSVLFVVTVIFSLYIKIADNTDLNAPQLSCDVDKISVSVDATDEEILKHVTATDEKDGDITTNVVIESISTFIDSNTAKIIFAVCDSDNNVSKLETDIEYIDYKNPVFLFGNQHVYYVGATKIDLMSGVSAEDLLEGDISERVVVSDSEIDLSQPGVYPVTYKVTTSKGITSEIQINAYVYSNRLKYNIELTDYLVYTDSASKIIPESYIEEYPEELINDEDYNYNYTLDVIDEVNYNKPGIYYITYRLLRTEKYDDTNEPEILAEAYLAVAVRGD